MAMGEWDDTALDTFEDLSHDTVLTADPPLLESAGEIRESTHTDWPPAPPRPRGSSDTLEACAWPAATGDEVGVAVWPAATGDELDAADDDLAEPPIRRAAIYTIVRRPTTSGD